MRHLRLLLDFVRSSLWFVPGLFVLGAIVLAQGLIELDHRIDVGALQRDYPRVFGISPAGARAILETIAGSMIGIAGVAFSITIVALTLASSQYTSRVLRNFMRDRANQSVLGAFVGIFIYCLLVQRAVLEGGDNGFAPASAVLFAVLLAFVGIGCLIFFIHHIAMSIQAERIVRSATDETIRAIDRLFPDGIGGSDDDGDGAGGRGGDEPPKGMRWRAVCSASTGYVQSVDLDGMVALARERETIVRVLHAPGVFVVEGSPIVEIGCAGEPDRATIDALRAVVAIGHQRTMVQDAGFGIRQIVDVALKALSPGVNDTTTAVTCVEHLGAIVARLGGRRIGGADRSDDDGEARVIMPAVTFAGLLGEAFDQIRQNAGGNVGVMMALIRAIEVVGGHTPSGPRRAELRRELEMVCSLNERTVPEPRDRASVDASAARVRRMLGGH
ncbi:MAG: DUF2254 domain-containing protein [Phycisphaerales bacterium]